MSSCGKALIAETITDATGNISRGMAIFRTMALLRTIERVPEENVSVKNWHPDDGREHVEREVRHLRGAGPAPAR